MEVLSVAAHKSSNLKASHGNWHGCRNTRMKLIHASYLSDKDRETEQQIHCLGWNI